MKRMCGMTLIEVLVVLLVLSALWSLGAPAFSPVIHNTRLAAYTNNFLAGLALARSESIRRGRRVVLCKSSNGSDCTKVGEWSGGWLIFEDANNDAVRDASETVIRHAANLPQNWRLTGNLHVANYISYHPTGRSRLASGAFQAGTLTLCELAEETKEGVQIVISSAGRPRSVRLDLKTCF
jgi:type IV fimbrial biogenesis protein FimT